MKIVNIDIIRISAERMTFFYRLLLNEIFKKKCDVVVKRTMKNEEDCLGQ